MNIHKSKIEWCSHTWNPVTGCLHGCPYCYARVMTNRFKPHAAEWPTEETTVINEANSEGCFIAMRPTALRDPDGNYLRSTPYPKGFSPTIHMFTMNYPEKRLTPSRIFVSSMGDLFGDWVPESWITTVLNACAVAPQHIYMFLTKNPKRYIELAKSDALPRRKNFWYGTSTPTGDTEYFWGDGYKTFISVEPILGPFTEHKALTRRPADWVIVGAMTGAGAKKHQPKREWIQGIVDTCRHDGTPLFMKDSILPIWEDPLIRQYPAGMLAHTGEEAAVCKRTCGGSPQE
ncbi:MAG: phage Gp37/Gp68 family protein [Christensenellaceae bacterium]|nr:phage Gp37/Gp68 family protein [Christensenellaceae bacterium]